MNGLINDKMIQALCWTLLHSLWQGLAVAIIAAILIMVTRRSAPAFRYNLLTALFLLFIVVTGFTFARQILFAKKNQPETVWLSPVIQPFNNASIIQDNSTLSTTVETTYFTTIAQYFNSHASVIVVTWFILFIVKLARILANVGYVQHIRRYQTFSSSSYWKQRIIELAQSLFIQKSVILLESAIIKVPMVIGLLKPAILVPLGLLSSLPPQQVEAVLLHELAHIRRKDYLVNLLQSFAEVVFFFNPPILWVSSLLREERENCCDDIAIGRIKNKKQFIYALVAFQEYAMNKSNTRTAIAFAGQKKYLLNRVKRIIYNENKKLNAMEKGFFIFSIAIISLVGFVSIKQIPAQKGRSSNSAFTVTNILDSMPTKESIVLTDTIPGPVEFKNITSVINKDGDSETRTITATDKNGKKYKIIMKNNEPMELHVNDKKIPSEELNNYGKLITSIEQEVEFRQKRDTEKMKKAQAEQSEKMMQLDAERSQLLQKLNAIDQERSRLNYEKIKGFDDHEWDNAARLNLLNDQLFKMRNEAMNNRDLAEQLLYHKNESLKMDTLFQQDLFKDNLKTLNENFLNNLIQDQVDQKYQAQLLYEKLNILQQNPLEQQQQRSFILIDPIIEDLAAEKIIPAHQEDVSFELNNDVFIVNGKKQPAEVHERYQKKYLKKDGDYFKFSRKNGSTSTTIHLN